MHPDVVVIGSLNMDLVVRTPRLPKGGETLAGHAFATAPGGKGANQAVAAARLGAQVAMIGCVGADPYGDFLTRSLVQEGIDCRGVSVANDVPTGIASILVDDQGQNAIVIVAGGNGELSVAHLQAQEALLAKAKIVIAQLEVPLATVGGALARARALGKTVILNPAPATGPLPADWYAHIDYLVPNESEASLLTGLPVDNREQAEAAARQLIAAGARQVLLTLGSQGLLQVTAEGCRHHPATPVQAVDTTAAGDTFLGGFAAGLAEGLSVTEAIALGQRAAAIAVTRPGAQPSIPTRQELAR
ncbi:ribokinase [Pseudomonas oryzihabitans]|uniref:ribokinase n=1 Tax=Pseudomonas oryzihabitans TaxID=47885 RepID=UPI002895338E|nr:ribokinase [Pseudomonas oryzihabitans]MDT3720986.1 ribokinase [Pseudomonas oryzihabitans]